MKLQLKNLKKNYLSAQKYFKKKKLKNFCVTITTNTSTGEKKTYLPPLREIGKTIIFGVVVYSTEQLKKICLRCFRLRKYNYHSGKGFCRKKISIPYKWSNYF